MITRTFRKTGEKISHLGFGGMRFPTKPDGTIDRELAGKMLDLAYENGVRYFDTAYGYHNGESAKFFGDFLCTERKDRYPRSSFKIANKFPLWPVKEKADVDRIFNYQLECVKTDYFDFYLLHAMNGELWQKAKDFGVYEYCDEKRKAGIVKNLGFSFHGTVDDLDRILAEGNWDFVQLQFNYLDYFTGSAKAEYESVSRYGIPVTVMEPLRGGALAKLSENAMNVLSEVTSSSPAEFALRFCSSFDKVLVILSGMSTLEQTAQNVKTFEDIKPLSDEEMKGAMRVASAIKEGKYVPCTGCRYCTEECPMSISIPEAIADYNKFLASNTEENPARLSAFLDEEAGKCIGCGACAEKCPQGIDIPGIFEAVRS